MPDLFRHPSIEWTNYWIAESRLMRDRNDKVFFEMALEFFAHLHQKLTHFFE